MYAVWSPMGVCYRESYGCMLYGVLWVYAIGSPMGDAVGSSMGVGSPMGVCYRESYGCML